MDIVNAGRKLPSPSQPCEAVNKGRYTKFDSQSGSVHAVDVSATYISDYAQRIKLLLHRVKGKVSLSPLDVECCKISKKLFASELKIIITNYGYQKAIQFLSQWPEYTKGQMWFCLLIDCLFNHRESPVCESMIAELTLQKDSAEAPIAAYLTVLKKLQAEGGLYSSVRFKQFMDWLICWNLSEVQPRIDLLEQIPDSLRRMRPDLPITQDFGAKMQSIYGWGGFPDSMEHYLAHTQWIQHCMICAFIEYAPPDFVQPVIESWLEADDVAIRDKLFTQEQHPLSICYREPRPWNIMLAALDRLLPRLGSPLSQAISKLDGSDYSVEQMDENFIDRLKLPRQSLVFGRTIAFLDPKNLGHFYLKFQSRDESDKVFFSGSATTEIFL